MAGNPNDPVDLGGGWLSLPGGQFYNTQTNEIRTTSQMAHLTGAPDAAAYLPQNTVNNPNYRTPTMVMDESGNLVPLTQANTPNFQTTTLDQNNGGMLGNVNGVSAVTQYPFPANAGSNLTYSDNPNNQPYLPPGPEPKTQQDLMQWLMGQLQNPQTQTPQPLSPVNQNLGDIRTQVSGVNPFQPSAPVQNGTTLMGSSGITDPVQNPVNPVQRDLQTVQDTSAWRAAPTALTDYQRGRGMLLR